MSSFVIKIIAIISMLCDHGGYLLLGHFSVLNIVGRIAFPLFAFQLVIGYEHTSNLKKYLLRLLIFAFISQIPFYIMFHTLTDAKPKLNIFFTLLLGICSMYIYDNCFDNEPNNRKIIYDHKPNTFDKFPISVRIVVGVLLMPLVLFLAYFLNVDYSIWGVLLILFIHVFYNKNKNKLKFSIGYLILCSFEVALYFGYLSYSWLLADYIFTALPLIFMLLYNQKKGPSLKYFFYAFYPIHLIILELIHYLLFN